MKKLIFALLSCTLLLTACGSSEVEAPSPVQEPIAEILKEDTPVSEMAEEPEEPVVEPDPEEPIEIPEEVSPEQFVADVQSAIQGDIGSGEVIKDVKLDNGKLYVYVDFSQGDFSTFSAADIARSRTSSITDDILALEQYDSLWDSITVDFGNVGYIENSHSAIKDEGYGRYFDLDSKFSENHLDGNAVISETPATNSGTKSSSTTTKSKSSNNKTSSSNLQNVEANEPLAQSETVPSENEPQIEEPAPVEEPPAPESEEEKPVGEMVWLSATGEKYHSINNCGRMNPDKARLVTLDDALKMGKEKCSNCY